jgi:hypothetical protein
MLVVFVRLLAAFIYQIIITPLTAVDAPTVIKSAAAPSGPAPPLPVRQPRVPAATGAARGTSSEGPLAGRGPGARPWRSPTWLRSSSAAGCSCTSPPGAACSPRAVEVCSQGFVLLTGTQLAGGAIAVAGIGALVIAIVLAVR